MEINCKYEDNVILYTRCSEDVCVYLLSLPAQWRALKSVSYAAHASAADRCLRSGVH